MVLTPGNGAAFQSRDSSGNLSATTNTGGGGYVGPRLGRIGAQRFDLHRICLRQRQQLDRGGVLQHNHEHDALRRPVRHQPQYGPYQHGHLQRDLDQQQHGTAARGPHAAPGPQWTDGQRGQRDLGRAVLDDNDNLSFANEVYLEGPGSTTFSWIATVPAIATAYLDTGLTPGDSYSYQVLASNTVGNTASNTATATTPVPPLAVSDLQPASIATTSAGLSWVLNSTNDTGVQVCDRPTAPAVSRW